MKTESVAEFLARGGKITFVNPQATARKRAQEKKQEEVASEVKQELIPESLKIALGIK